MWDLNRLRIWRAVVSEESITAAARNLQYAPASVSQQVIALQKSVGFPLYRKVGRGIEITDAGRRLAQEAEGLFEQADKLSDTVDAIRSGPIERLSISCFASVAKEWIPAVLIEAGKRYPSLHFDVMTNEPLALAERVFGDIGIVNTSDHHVPEAVVGYERELLLEDDYLIVMPADHPLAELDDVPMADLADERMVDLTVQKSPSGEVVGKATRAAGLSPHYVARADDHYGILAMVRAGVGLSILPRLTIADLPEPLVARRLIDPTPVRYVVMFTRRDVAHLGHVMLAQRRIRALAKTVRGYAES